MSHIKPLTIDRAYLLAETSKIFTSPAIDHDPIKFRDYLLEYFKEHPTDEESEKIGMALLNEQPLV